MRTARTIERIGLLGVGAIVGVGLLGAGQGNGVALQSTGNAATIDSPSSVTETAADALVGDGEASVSYIQDDSIPEVPLADGPTTVLVDNTPTVVSITPAAPQPQDGAPSGENGAESTTPPRAKTPPPSSGEESSIGTTSRAERQGTKRPKRGDSTANGGPTKASPQAAASSDLHEAEAASDLVSDGATQAPPTTSPPTPSTTTTVAPPATTTTAPESQLRTFANVSDRSGRWVGGAETRLVNGINGQRRRGGVAELNVDLAATIEARRWSRQMAESGVFDHRSDLSVGVPGNLIVAENVAMGGHIGAIHNGLLDSEGHRANMDSVNFDRVGVGVWFDKDTRTFWVTQIFLR